MTRLVLSLIKILQSLNGSETRRAFVAPGVHFHHSELPFGAEPPNADRESRSLKSVANPTPFEPSEFLGTVVRTTINHFSTIHRDHSSGDFAETIDAFFTEVSHIVARYRGRIHEISGDEIVFYFRDQDVDHSFLMALSALRDIHRSSEKMHEDTLRRKSYPFSVKSALAYGSLSFTRIVDRWTLSGPILVETRRLVSVMPEKNGNVVVFDHLHSRHLDSSFHYDFCDEPRLRGFSWAKRLQLYRSREAVDACFDWRRDELLGRLTYFRSDSDLHQILRWMRGSWGEAPVHKVLRLIGTMRLVEVVKTDGEALCELHGWIDDLLAEAKCDPLRAEGINKIIASALKLLGNLTPPGHSSIDASEKLVERAMLSKDRRVVSNGIEVLAALRQSERSMVKALTEHVDHRVAATALVHEGMRELSPFVVRRLRKMMDSRRAVGVASSLFALGEIAKHQSTLDPEYLANRRDFHLLLQALPRFMLHEDEIVRRQARIAAEKVDDVEVWRLLGELIAEPAQDPVRAAKVEEIRASLGAKLARSQDAKKAA